MGMDMSRCLGDSAHCPFRWKEKQMEARAKFPSIGITSEADEPVAVACLSEFEIDRGPICLVLTRCTEIGVLKLINFPFVHSVDLSALTGDVELPSHCFAKFANIRDVRFPKGLRRIGARCFSCCGLVRVDLSGTRLHEIEEKGFEFCVSLCVLVVPDDLRQVGSGCWSRSGVPSGDLSTIRRWLCPCVRHLNEVASDQPSLARLTTVDISRTQIAVLPSSAFSCCPALRMVSFPRGLEEIGAYCFRRTALERVELRHCRFLRRLQQQSFATCALKDVTLPMGVREVEDGAFGVLDRGSGLGRWLGSDCGWMLKLDTGGGFSLRAAFGRAPLLESAILRVAMSLDVLPGAVDVSRLFSGCAGFGAVRARPLPAMC
jgi:hypothetical protein